MQGKFSVSQGPFSKAGENSESVEDSQEESSTKNKGKGKEVVR
jgi:hypothetical protein